MRSPLLSVFSLFLLFAALAPALTLEAPAEIRSCAGETLYYNAYLEQGRAPLETFSLELSAPSGFTSYATPQLTLDSQERGTVGVYATPLLSLLPGDYSFDLRATGNSGVSTQASTLVKIQDCSLVRATLVEPSAMCGCGYARFEVIVSNKGSAGSSVSLSSPLEGVQFSKNNLFLPAGTEENVSFYASVPCDTSRVTPFEVFVRSRSGTQQLDSVLSPRACVQVPSPESSGLEGVVITTLAQSEESPSGLTGLFAAASGSWPLFFAGLLVLALLGYLWYKREESNEPVPAPMWYKPFPAVVERAPEEMLPEERFDCESWADLLSALEEEQTVRKSGKKGRQAKSKKVKRGKKR